MADLLGALTGLVHILEFMLLVGVFYIMTRIF
jgi:hypothetical protein